MDIMSMLAAIPAAGPLLPYISVVIAACAALATLLPHPGTGATGIYAFFFKLVNFIALNVGNAKNAVPPAPQAASSAPANS